jgi:hypothetical protein
MRVRKNGRVLWNNRSVVVSAALRHGLIGLSWEETHWGVHFGPLRVGTLQTRGRGLKFIRAEDERHLAS